MTEGTMAKLAQLRAKTDRQVLDYIGEQLRLAAQLAFRADQARRIREFGMAKRYQERSVAAMRMAKQLREIVAPLRTEAVPEDVCCAKESVLTGCARSE
jgi:hypothetical protein